MSSAPAPDDVAWRPDETTRARAQLTQFIGFCRVGSFDELHRRSVEDVAWFTDRVLRFLEISFDPPYTLVIDVSRGIAWARWCIGGGLNITNCLDRHAKTRGEQPAIVWEGEEGTTRRLGYAELAAEVGRCAAGLRALDLTRGDAVGIHLPMMPETVVALLAIGRIGGIAVPLFSGYGPQAIETRLTDVQAKALITCDGFPRRGKSVAALDAATAAVERCPSIRHLIVVPRANVPLSRRRRPERQRRGGGQG